MSMILQTLMLPYLETLPSDWHGCAHSFANLVVWNIVIKRQKRDLLYDYFMIATLVAFCISDFVVKLVLKASDQSKISYHDHRPEKKWSWIGMLSEWNQNCPTNISENLYWYTLDSGGLDVCFGVILKSSEKYWIVRLGVTFTSVQQPTVGALGCSGRGPRLPGWIAEDEKLLRGLLPLIITIQFNSCRYSLHAESGSSMQSKNFGHCPDRCWPRLPLHKLEYLLPANHPRQGWQWATSNMSWWCNRWVEIRAGKSKSLIRWKRLKG